MKAVYLSSSGQVGGGERTLLNIISSLRTAEPRWRLELIAGSDGPLVAEAQTLGIPVRVLPFPAELAGLGDAGAGGPAGKQVDLFRLLGKCLQNVPRALEYTAKLRRLLAAAAPDVIHTSGFKMHILGSRSRPKRSAVLWHVQDYVRSRPLMSAMLRHHTPRCTAALTVSNSIAADLTLNCGKRLRTYTVYNGVDLQRFTPLGSKLDLDALSGMPPAETGTIRVGLVATFSRWKGHLVFLKALAALPDDLRIRGYVIGGSIYQTIGSQFTLDELRSEAARLKVSHKVGFTGFVDDTAAAIRALDVVAHASTAPEPFGLVIAEGMACGRPVIVSESGGAAEIVSIGVDALAHPPGAAGALSDRIRQLTSEPALRAKLGSAARSTAERRFDRTRTTAELVPIYREIRSLSNQHAVHN